MATTSTIQSDIRSALHATNIIISNPSLILSRATSSSACWSFSPRPLISSHYRISTPESFRVRAFSTESTEPVVKVPDKPPICTADELHYVSVSNSDWRLALWRYHPSPQVGPTHSTFYALVHLKSFFLIIIYFLSFFFCYLITGASKESSAIAIVWSWD
jgi:hypothetical protein